MRLYCNNQVVVHITENSIFHKHTKHIEMNYHFVCQKIKEKIVQAQHVSSYHQLTNLLTVFLRRHELILFVNNWACIMYMLQLETEC